MLILEALICRTCDIIIVSKAQLAILKGRPKNKSELRIVNRQHSPVLVLLKIYRILDE